MAAPGETTDLLLDVTGYFVAGTFRIALYPLEPARVLDTRVANGRTGPLTANVSRTWTVGGRGGVHAAAVAVVGNVTVVLQTRAG